MVLRKPIMDIAGRTELKRVFGDVDANSNRTAPGAECDAAVYPRLHAGLDWSRARTGSEYLCVACLVAVQDQDRLARTLAAVPAKRNVARVREFHASGSSPAAVTAAVNALLDTEMFIGVHMTRLDSEAAGYGARDPENTALPLLHHFIQRQPLASLSYDVEIEGVRRSRTFCTTVKRMHRQRWPRAHVRVRGYRSHQSPVIQAADIIAYAFSLLERRALKDAGTAERLTALSMDPRCIFIDEIAPE